MTAIDGCKHTLAKSAVPVCLDCYKELQTILAEARQHHATLEHSFAMSEQSEQVAQQQLQHVREALAGLINMVETIASLAGGTDG
mgnify:CR=1 FL=1